MIKGCAKRVVVVRDIESNFFEEAFFIVRQGSPSRVKSESDFINEANRIVKSDLSSAECKIPFSGFKGFPPSVSAKKNRRREKFREAVLFFSGFGLSAVIFTVIYYSGIVL